MFNYPNATYVEIILGSNQINLIPIGIFKFNYNATIGMMDLSLNSIKTTPSDGTFEGKSLCVEYTIISYKNYFSFNK